ncbi:MAG TPA: deoxyribonuclease IV [Candidatus Limnocylindrales bacterium]|jgi:deoxyribonuclease-4
MTVDRAEGEDDRASATPGARTPRVRLPGGRRAGAHLPLSLGLVRVVERAAEIGASTLQIFSDNPTAWHRRAETPPEAQAFRQRLVELDIGPVAIHAPYLVNLAGPDDVLFARSVGLMRHELEHAPQFKARFVNVHVGSHRGAGRDPGVRRLIDGLDRATDGLPSGGTDPGAPLIVLENSSGGGFAIGATIEELAMVLDAAAAKGLGDRLAVCLDTAHLWGADYDVSSPAAIDDLLATFDRLVGLHRLAMVHLNDSHSAKGSRNDRHAHLGEGLIGRDGLAHMLCHPSLDHVAFYLETPRMEDGFDAVNVARLGDLAAGRPLTPGPVTESTTVASGEARA